MCRLLQIPAVPLTDTPLSVIEAIAFTIGSNAVLINNLTEQIAVLMERRESIKQKNAELTAWMEVNKP